jgi:integrase
LTAFQTLGICKSAREIIGLSVSDSRIHTSNGKATARNRAIHHRLSRPLEPAGDGKEDRMPSRCTLHGLHKTLGKLLAESGSTTCQLMETLDHDDTQHAE